MFLLTFSIQYFSSKEKIPVRIFVRFFALKYAIQDMDCPFHPKIVHYFPIASSSEHWQTRETRCKSLMSQSPGTPGRQLVRGGGLVKVLQEPLVVPHLHTNVPWRHLW